MAEDWSEDTDVVAALFGSCGARIEDNASAPSVGSSVFESTVGDAATLPVMRAKVTRSCMKRIV